MHPSVRSYAAAAAVSVLLAGAFAASLARASHTPGPETPNILVIVTDDQRAGTTDLRLPDGSFLMYSTWRFFQEQGTTFSQSYATTPNCCPSRASIFTGRYAHNHGVRSNTEALNLDPATTLQRYLKDAGYETGLFGKYLNQWVQGDSGQPIGGGSYLATRNPPYFDNWAVVDNGAYYPDGTSTCPVTANAQPGVNCVNEQGELKRLPDDTYATTYIGNKAAEFIDQTETDDTQPWFLYVAPTAPHEGFGRSFGEEVVESRYRGSAIPAFQQPASFGEDVSDKPSFVEKNSVDLARITRMSRSPWNFATAVPV